MDLGLLFGFLGTWVLIFWAMLSGGSLAWFIDPPSIILVIGGSITVLIMSYPLGVLKKLHKIFLKAFLHKSSSPEKLIDELVSFAEIARRDGILSLENAIKEIDDPFIVSGIQMAIDGTDPELIQQVMENELDTLVDRHDNSRGTLDNMGKYAPAFGMIGTLVGLVVMLQNMDDPSKIGPGMAIALLTTMYGAVISNAIMLPMSERLAKRSAEEVLHKTIIIKGVMAIQSGDNPRVVEQKLRTYLPPSQRKEEAKEAA